MAAIVAATMLGLGPALTRYAENHPVGEDSSPFFPKSTPKSAPAPSR